MISPPCTISPIATSPKPSAHWTTGSSIENRDGAVAGSHAMVARRVGPMMKPTDRRSLRRLAAIWTVFSLLSLPVLAIAEEPFRLISPAGSTPHPAVLLVPGCSGFTATNGVNLYDERAAVLQAAGYAVVFVDYVGRRMQNNCAHVSLPEVSADILEAASWVRDQSGIDGTRISVIGWSYGGGGVLATLKALPPGSPAFSKAAMYYPVCRGAAPWTTNTTGLILLGALDDIAFPALCDAVAKGMSSDKLRTITYPNARHGFDMRGLPDRPDQPSGAPAYNAEADQAAWAVVLDFLK
jgi:dienelactone hydrolase